MLQRLLSTKYMVKTDMQRGEIPPSKEAYGASLRIALPAVVEMVSLSLMGMIDTVMVGRLDGYGVAVAAVGLTNQPRFMFLAVFFALNIAVTAIVARNKGAGDMAAARSCLKTALGLNIVLGIILTAAAVSFSSPMMNLAGAQTDTIDAAASYFRITSSALILQAITMTICAAQRAIGNTRITMKVNVIAKILSVALNFLLIEGRFGFPRLEVNGAAISTVIAATVAFCLAAYTIFQKDSQLRIFQKKDLGGSTPDTPARDKSLDPDTLEVNTSSPLLKSAGQGARPLRGNWGWNPQGLDLPMLKSITRLASGGMVEQVGLRTGFFLYALVVANLGTEEFAAHLITMQLMALSFTFADGIGIATTSLVGQNLGKNRPDLSIMYGKIGLRLALGFAAVLSVMCVLIRFYFPMLFTSYSGIIETAAGLILMLAVIMPFQTTQVVMGGSLRGAGDTRYVAITMILTVGILRPLGGFLLTYPLGLGLAGAWIAVLIDQIARLAMLFTRFVRGRWIN